MKPWEAINKAVSKTSVFTDEELIGYNNFILNRGLAGNKGMVLVANALNRPLTERMHSDFLVGFLNSKTYTKWYKAPKSSDDISFIAEYYQVNKEKAEEYLELLTPKQLKELKTKFGKVEKRRAK